MEPVKNGADEAQASGAELAGASGLLEAIHAHGAALLKASAHPNGTLQINIPQLWIDLELLTVRLEVMFEALVAKHVLDPADLTVRLRDKLFAEAKQLDAQSTQIQVARGHVPRNG